MAVLSSVIGILKLFKFVTGFAPTWERAGMVPPSLHRRDCFDSDHCCFILTEEYFDNLPLAKWGPAGRFPTESFGVKSLNRFVTTLHGVIHGEHFFLTTSTICAFKCKDLTLLRLKDSRERRKLPWTFSLECPEGLVVAKYVQQSRQPVEDSNAATHLEQKCRCVKPEWIEYFPMRRHPTFGNTRRSEGYERLTKRQKLNPRRSSCLELRPFTNRPVEDSFDTVFASINAEASSSTVPESLHMVDVSCTPYIKLSDVSATSIEPRIEPGPMTISVDPHRTVRACIVVPGMATTDLVFTVTRATTNQGE